MTRDSRDIKTLEESLAWAIGAAADAHFGDVDKGGKPYILHPIRVMMAMDSLEEKITAVLHDTMEDGMMSKSEIVEYANGVIARAVVAMTRKKDESYGDYILRVRENNLARRVKIADLKDNLDRSRIPIPTAQDEARWAKYEKALAVLQESFD